MATEKLSPMMQQYQEIKKEYEDAILMFRLGDFYEMFFDDALLASRVLELTLTGRNCGLEEKAPMCGVPFHAVDSYIARLVKNGYKVAICEQMEDPAEARGIVKRDIVRVYTPGTLDISDSTDANDNLYIACVCVYEKNTGLTLADVNTGELISTEFVDNGEFDILINELAVYNPQEVVINELISDDLEHALENEAMAPFIAAVDASYFKKQSCEKVIMNQFDVTSLIPLGLDGKEEIAASIGALLMYLRDTQKQEPSQFKDLVIKNIGNTMQLDRSTMRNLELLETLYDKDVHGSLLGVLNKTRTAMGARLLKSFLREPLKDADEINMRLDAVEELKNAPLVANNITNSLKNVYDFQRLTARIATGKANGRDLIALKTTLAELPEILSSLEYLDAPLIREISTDIGNFGSLHDMIERAITEEPPFLITEGGIIRPGYSAELDELKASIADAKTWIANLEAVEKERTGIKTLKVGFNKVFGYYIDVSKGMIDRVPDDYVRKQTLVNNERYITPELKEKENMVFSAENRINKLEYEEFKAIRDSVEPYIDSLQRASAAIALLDVLISFAKVATDNAYVKPVVNDSDVLDIRNGRHPSVEQMIGSGMFVSNDTYCNGSDRNMLIITGPNMSGKSTYMRQTAIIVLMAQIGCYVPAESAVIGVVDRVFTRIGASDNLSYGQSTFYIEMSELANILRHATSRSLIILDEIGRGTSTFDGLSIAWATVEYLCKPENRIRTMFATHYHELTELADTYSNVHNLSVAVAENGNNIVFLHNIVDGPASKSYGIHVAQIAGVPEEIRTNARIKLRELEDGAVRDNAKQNSEQLSFFAESFKETSGDIGSEKYNEFIARIAGLDVNVMTPVAALNTLQGIIDEATDIKGADND